MGIAHVVLVLFVLLSCISFSSSRSCPGVDVSFTSHPVSPRIGSDFISFSVEVDVILEWTGRSNKTTRPEFTAMMAQLGRPTIRVGGDSTDYSWYNPHHRPYPPYRTRPFRYNITDLDVLSIVHGVRSYDGQAVIGLNFRDQGNAQWAVEHLLAIDRLVGANNPAILAYEIGNEIDLYPDNGDRVPSWSPEDYYTEWEYYVAQLRRAVPHLHAKRFQAATYCCFKRPFEDDIPSLVARDAPLMRTLSMHNYPDDSSNRTTLELQLSDAITQQVARLIVNGTKAGNLVKLLAKHHVELVIGETNTNVEPGRLGVCDVFAGSALWYIDTTLELAAAGIVRVHTHAHEQDLRAPVFFEHSPPGVGQPGHYPNIRPLYYGLRFVAMLIEGGNAAVINRTVLCTNDPLVKVWAVQTTNGTVRIAIIHKDLHANASTTVQLDLSHIEPAPPTTIWAVRLLGTALQKENITLAGQTYTGSTDGLPHGDFVQEQVVSTGGGLYELDVDPITAVLLSTVKFSPFEWPRDGIRDVVLSVE